MHRPCMINRIRVLKQHTLQVNGHAWFHLYGFWRAAMNRKGGKIQNENKCLRRESKQRPLAFQLGTLYCLATRTDVLLCLKFLPKINNAAILCIKLIMVRCVLEQTVRQNLHFFYKCRCYLLLFTKLCKTTQNHNQFDKCIVMCYS